MTSPKSVRTCFSITYLLNYIRSSTNNYWKVSNSIIVIGSSNTDMVIKADHLPAPGETILGGTFLMNAGGKGANQAVAASRLGGLVTFIAKTGNDIFGKRALELFNEEGLETSFIISDPVNPSGVALITVDKNAENCIVVASGANAALDPKDLYNAESTIEQAGIILLQLEIPVATIEYIVMLAAKNNIRIVLNPAPARTLSNDLMKHVSIITPNETEAYMLTDVRVVDDDTAEKAARILHAKGISTVIITLGERGALLLHQGIISRVNSPKVTAVDTTAAGDVFNGALVVALSKNKNMLEAVQFACQAAAICVTRMGAQSSAPYLHEMQNTWV